MDKINLTEIENNIVIVMEKKSEEKKIQNIELQLSKLKELLIAKDQYLALVVHDIKNLIHPIINYSEMLRIENITLEKVNFIAKKLNIIASNVMDISTRLLDEAKFKNNPMTPYPAPFNLHSMVERIIQILGPQWEKKTIIIHNNIDPSQIAFADVDMIQSVITNLLDNAIKFTHLHGEISIFSKKREDNLIEIAIQDSGEGIDETMMDHILQNRDFISTKGTEGEVGTGFGVSFCKLLIEKNGGFLWIENVVNGKGSIFYFTLPIPS